MSQDVECPYCEEWLEICHDDGFGYEEGVAHQMECYECRKNFTFQTNISFTYHSDKADCLNGSPHDFKEWRKIWDKNETHQIQDRRCRACELTERRMVLKNGL